MFGEDERTNGNGQRLAVGGERVGRSAEKVGREAGRGFYSDRGGGDGGCGGDKSSGIGPAFIGDY